MMDKVINLALIKNPLNWVIVFLMIVLGGMAAEIVFKQFSKEGV
jgi:hypothetical protein